MHLQGQKPGDLGGRRTPQHCAEGDHGSAGGESGINEKWNVQLNLGGATPHHLLNHAAKHDELQHHLKKSRHSSGVALLELPNNVYGAKTPATAHMLQHAQQQHDLEHLEHWYCDAAHTRQEVKKLSATALLEYRFRKVIRKPKPMKIMIDTWMYLAADMGSALSAVTVLHAASTSACDCPQRQSNSHADMCSRLEGLCYAQLHLMRCRHPPHQV
jgi:hypothetical protein